MIYLYAIIDSKDEMDGSINGIDGTTLFNIPYNDIGIASNNIDKQVKEEEKHILEHEQAIERLMNKFTVLPVRFNTIFNEREAVLSMMKDYYTDFRENLTRLHHKVEFGLKVIWEPQAIKKRIINAISQDNLQAISDGTPARTFLKEKFEEYKIENAFKEEADRCIEFIDNFFNKISIEKRLKKLQTERLLLNASYLVEKEKESDFEKAFDELKSARSDLKYLFSGPWPPYNFVTLTKKFNQPMFSPVDVTEPL